MKPSSVLIVEDNDINRSVLSRALGRDFSVMAASSAEEGLRLAEKGSFAVVLLDVTLPGISGLRALSAFTATGALVVLMTGDPDPQLEEDARLLGARGFLPKPLDIPSLGGRLRALLTPRF